MIQGRDPAINELIEYFDSYGVAPSEDGTEGGWVRLANYPNEIKVIEEQIRKCREDFSWFARNYVWITDKKSKVIPLHLNEGQELILDRMAYLKSLNRAQKLICLKARQVGCSTLVEAMILWRTVLFSGVSAIIVSNTPSHASYLFGMMQFAYDKLPWWMRPMTLSRKIEDGLIFDNKDHDERRIKPGLNSKISVQAANQHSGVGQGRTVTACHLCLSPYAPIKTSGGVVKQMKDIVPGDMVLTSSGYMKTVKAVLKSSRSDEISSKLWMWGEFSPLETTTDHKVLTPNGFVEAGKLRGQDYVRMPVKRITDDQKIRPFIKYPTGGSWRLHKGGVPYTAEMNYDWGWLLGLYLAEGTVGINSRLTRDMKASHLVFSIHEDEEAYVMERLKRVLGADKNIRRAQRGSKAVRLLVYGSDIARFVNENFGRVDDKRIPDWAWGCGEEFCSGIVHGYLDGDGHITPNKLEIMASSIRLAIPIQIRDLIASLGYGWCALTYREAGNYYDRNCKAIWTLQICGTTARNLRAACGWPDFPATEALHWKYAENKTFVDIEIYRATEGYCESFYDLEVDAPEHDFCTIHCCVKNSEISDYGEKDAKDIVEGDLGHALADNVETFAVIESTARGTGNYFHRLWRKSVELEDMAEWMPVFIPWFFEKSRTISIPNVQWKPDIQEEEMRRRIYRDWTKCSNKKCGSFLEAMHMGLDQESSICKPCGVGTMERYILSNEQLHWMQIRRLNAQKDEDSFRTLKAEMTSTPEESFQLSGVKVFPQEVIDFVNNCITEPVIKGFFDKSGFVHGVSRKTGKCPATGCEADHKYDDLYLSIWDHPEKGARYTIGVDVAEGIDEDYSVAFVNKIGGLREPDVHVATIRSNTISPVAFAAPVAALGHLYNEALIAVEINRYDTTFSYIRNNLNYPNLYRWKNVNATETLSHKWGWLTNQRTKPRLYQTATHWLRHRMWVVKSKDFYQEMTTFQKESAEDRGAKAEKNFLDDYVIAGMISLYCSHDNDWDDNMGSISLKRYTSTDPDTYMWRIICVKCNEERGVPNPENHMYCHNCGSYHVRAEKNRKDPPGFQNLWEELEDGYETASYKQVSASNDYDLM